MRLTTACPPLDTLLDGGLEADAVTLVFGEGGSGKTNLALQCAREALRAGKRVSFVDTEGVSADRLQQLFGEGPVGGGTAEAGEAGRHVDGAVGDADDPVGETGPGIGVDTPVHAAGPSVPGQGGPDPLDRLLFFKPYTIGEQERMVQKSTLVQGLGLVVVDSINMHYRLHIDGEDAEKEASRSLYKQLHHLTNFARQHHVPVLVTGQVFGTEDATQPFARRIMEHLVKALVRFEKRPDGTRRATVVKHRSIPEGRQALFRIATEGLMAAGGDGGRVGDAGPEAARRTAERPRPPRT